jgi:topoisomerase-4 subunit A
MVPKGKLIEQIAQLIADRKLPILEDVRDESDEQMRLVLVPKSRNVDPELLKESLYKLTDLETRFVAQPQRARRAAHADGQGCTSC